MGVQITTDYAIRMMLFMVQQGEKLSMFEAIQNQIVDSLKSVNINDLCGEKQ